MDHKREDMTPPIAVGQVIAIQRAVVRRDVSTDKTEEDKTMHHAMIIV